MRPLIGITTYREPARWGTWDIPAVLLPASYADAVAAAGGEPVLLPTGATGLGVLARLHGLVLAAAPTWSRRATNSQPGRTPPPSGRTATPPSWTCSGGAGEGRAAAGDLPRHAAAERGAGRRPRAAPARRARHRAATTPGAGAVPASARCGSIPPACMAASRGERRRFALLPPPPGTRPDRRDGLTATAWAEDDVVEAVEPPGRRFCLGVQWHPEAGVDHRLFAAHVAAAGHGPGAP